MEIVFFSNFWSRLNTIVRALICSINNSRQILFVVADFARKKKHTRASNTKFLRIFHIVGTQRIDTCKIAETELTKHLEFCKFFWYKFYFSFEPVEWAEFLSGGVRKKVEILRTFFRSINSILGQSKKKTGQNGHLGTFGKFWPKIAFFFRRALPHPSKLVILAPKAFLEKF